MFRCKNLCLSLFQWALLASLLLTGAQQAQATHAMGGEITYECIGPNRYRVIIDAYRDCNGINLGTTAQLRYRSATCNVNTTINLQRQGQPVDITPLCGTAVTRCQSTAANPSFGVQRWRYVGEITLPAGCGADWILSWQLCCRNNAINTLAGAGGQDIYIETRLNNTLAQCNNSPQFLNIPTPFNCRNGVDSVFYNHGVFDPDGDSLRFALVPCLRAAGTSVNYAGGFSGASPLGGGAPVTIDPATGAIAFFPNANRVAVACVRVDEFRNGVLIGSVIRDIQFTVFACTNFLPSASAPFATTGGQTVINYQVTACFGTQFCFDILAQDANATQNLTVTWNGAIPGATFVAGPTGNPVLSRFCWTPQASNQGLNFFTVNVRDDACPVTGENTYTYAINVIANPNPPANAGPDVTICRGQTTPLTVTTAAPPATIDSIRWTPAVGLSSTTTASTNASPLATTTYTATIYYSDGCQSTDEVTVEVIDQPVVSVSPNNVNVCPGSTISLIASTDGVGNTFAWTQGATPLGSGVVAGTTSSLAVAIPATPGVYTYEVVVTNPVTGCATTGTTQLSVGIPPAEPECINIYVSTTGTPAASGTILDPTDLFTAINRSACNNAVIKVAQGTYLIDEPLSVTSLVTIEGGFDPANLWDKSSTPGATTIRRTRNNPEGVVDAQRLVAVQAIGATGFRLQDLTIETEDANIAAGDFGMSTYGIYLNGCNNYTIARVQVRAGAAGRGRNGDPGAAGVAGSNGNVGGPGAQDIRDNPGFGGDGGAGGSSGAVPAGGFGGTGGPAIVGTVGQPGANANPASRAGGAGGGGGSGGNVNSTVGAYNGYNGGAGGAGATGVGNTPTNAGVGTGGAGGAPGTAGTAGQFASTLPAGANGLAGGLSPILTSTATPFFQLGGQGANGANGVGGRGGAGGGGGGGEGPPTALAVRGSGNGGGGGGGGGEGGQGGQGGFSGGGSFGIYIFDNGANGRLLDCNILAGAAGAAGTGGAGGAGGEGGQGGLGATVGAGQIGAGGNGGFGQRGGNGGNGGNGRPGIAQNVVVNGTPLAASIAAFNLAAQPEIIARNVNCTNAPVQFFAPGTPLGNNVTTWTFDVANGWATPPTGVNNSDSTEYDSVARYTVAHAGNTYTGFHNVAFSKAFRPDILTNANLISPDTFQLCVGQFATFASSRFADTAIWDFRGAIPNPPNILSVPSTQFNNPGFYMVTLLLITDCCGDAPQDTIWLYVDPIPTATGSGPVAVCQDELATLTINGLQPTDSVIWTPTTNLNQISASQALVRPTATMTYTAAVYSVINTNGVDRLACPQTIDFEVTVNPRPEPTLTSTAVICNDDGTATASFAAGGPYTFEWETGTVNVGMTSTINNLAAGVYLITVTNNATGCDTVRSVFVAPAPALPQAVVQNTVDVTCFGANDGQATVGTINGTSPYTYVWSDGVTQANVVTSVRTGLAPINYCVTSTDQNGCFSVTCFDIIEPLLLQNNTVTVLDPTCVHTSDGVIEVEGFGGTGNITYQWSSPVGVTSSLNTGLAVGAYSVTLTDANNCTLTESYTLNPQNIISAAPVQSSPILCNGGTGGITVNGSGGSGLGTYNYTWSGGSSALFPNNQDVVSGAVAGPYAVTVTDINGCFTTATVTLTQPTAVTASVPTVVSVTCHGAATGSATAQGAGGTGAYTYLWSDPLAQNTQTAINLLAGSYTVTVIDVNGCTATASVLIEEPAQPLALVTSVTTDYNGVQISCFGASDGGVAVSASGGTAGYTYLWNDASAQTTASATGLPEGNYTVLVTDANACTATASVSLTQPAQLQVSIDNTVSVTCFGASTGSATAVSLGGTGVVGFAWSSTPVQNTATASNLPEGTYTVTATDANACTATATAVINEPATAVSATAAVISNFNGSDVSCFGASDGRAEVSPLGGTSGYTYSWGTTPVQTGAIATGLVANTYPVTITDANNCTTTASVTVNNPPAVTATINSVVSVTCHGAATGAATVDVTGGTGAFSFVWSDASAQTTATASNLVAGSYTVTVSDLNGCSLTASVLIEEPAQPLALVTSVTTNYNGAQISCFGASDGGVAVSASGGTAGYTYLWNDASAQTTASATGLPEGNYTVLVTDANACTATASVSLTQPAQLQVSIDNTVSVTCFGASTGSATAVSLGGTGVVGFAWSSTPVQNTATASNLPEGTYTVTATDANACTATATAVINEPATAVSATAAVISNFNGSDVSCFGASDGRAEVSPLGGTSGYTYSWGTTPVQTGAIATGLVAATYLVTVTDANNCTTTASVTVNDPPVVTATISSVVTVSCFNEATGAATASAGGGTGVLSYLWSDAAAQTTATATALLAGSYTVTISDENSCSLTLNVNIAQPLSPVSATASVISNYNGAQITCQGASDGQVSVLASGGTPSYTYAWSNGSATTNVISGLPQGSYTVTVTDARACTVTSTVSVTEPTAITASIASNTSVTCFGAATGAASVTAAGGTGAYTYLWDNGFATASINNVLASTYCATVSDANLCTATVCTTISEPATAIGVTATVSSNYNGQQISCFGASDGAATAVGAGGTGLITYNWSTNPAQTTATATGLAATTYAVTATDANNCQAVTTIALTQPSAITVTTQNQVNVSCFGGATGGVEAVANGGTGAFNFAWSNGATSAVLNNLVAGNYCVTVTDINGCAQQTCVNITQPIAPVTVAANASSNYNGFNVSCHNGSDGEATAFASGGTGLLSYLWVDGQTTAIATGLVAGNACVTVTDANACTATTCANLTQPLPLTVTVQNQTNVACRGAATGEVQVQGVGGVGTYTYTWSNGGNNASLVGLIAGVYCVTVADGNSCTQEICITITEPASEVTVTAAVTSSYNGQDVSCFGVADGQATAVGGGGTGAITYLWNVGGQTTATATGLADGVYCVTATDSRNCSASTCVTLTEPSAVTATAVVTANVSCFGGANGQAQVSANGGTGAFYNFVWSNGQTGGTAINLTAGLYAVTATDINGCEGVATFNISEPAFAVEASAVVSSNYNGQALSCFNATDGEATASAVGGTVAVAYQYQWGANAAGQTTAVATNLGAGVYNVTITDDNGCSDAASVTISQPSLVVGTVVSTSPVSCFGACTGSATLTANGGVAPYSYLWEAAAGNQTTATAVNLCAGSYNVTITDANGCSSVAVVVIGQPLSYVDATVAVTSNYNGAQISCFGATDGQATVSATDGTAPYIYLWDNGQTTATATGLGVGLVQVTVTDALGCTDVAQVTLVSPSAVTATIGSVLAVDCQNAATGSATALGQGGTGASYSFNWSDGQTTATATNLPTGNYSVTVSDLNACEAVTTINISEPATALAAFASVSSNYNGADISCTNSQNGEVFVSAAGGTGPYSYQWSAGLLNQLTATASGAGAGVHEVTVTDANGCTTSASVTVTAPAQVVAQVLGTSNVSCFNGSNGTANASGLGGVGGYTFAWDGGQVTPTAVGLPAGSYNVTVSDANGCASVAVAVINQPVAAVQASAVVSSNYNGAQITCFGASDGEATASALGGTAPYSFLWSDGQTDALATGLAAGTYTVTVTDALGCTGTTSVSLSAPAAVQVQLLSTVDVDCRGNATGTASVLGQDGVGAYSYVWSNAELTSTVNNLVAGLYTVTVSDQNNCSANLAVVIAEPALSLTANASVTSNYLGAALSCHNSTDGEALVVANGGSAPYAYVWSNGSLAATTTGLSAGSHNVTVTDANGCAIVATVTITAPSAVVATVVNTTDVDCSGNANGTATVAGSGGTGGVYSYLWFDGQATATATGLAAGAYSVTVTDANGCSVSTLATISVPAAVLSASVSVTSSYNGAQVSCFGAADGQASLSIIGGSVPYTVLWSDGQTGLTATNLAAGSYCATATDANGCVAVSCATVNNPPVLQTALQSQVNVACFGGATAQATVSASGGTGTYTYLWSDALAQTTATASNLSSGSYNVTVNDANACLSVLTVNISQPASAVNAVASVISNYNGAQVSCAGSSNGIAEVTALGGVGPYTYLWASGGVNTVEGGLGAGVHQVTVTDANLCSTTASVTVSEPTALSLVTSSTPVNCFGGSTGTATVVVSGGTGAYSYAWPGGQNTATAVGYPQGSYVVTVNDANGCVRTATAVISQPASGLVINTTIATPFNGQQLSCFGSADASATVVANGGSAPYSYLWSDAQATATASNLIAGGYCVTVTDATGCVASACITVVSPALLSLSVSNQTDASCTGASSGSATVAATGGTGAYSFVWSTGTTTTSDNNLPAGIHVITVTDANGCEDILSLTIGQPAQAVGVQMTLVTAVNCNGGDNAVIEALGFGGTAPYAYQWSANAGGGNSTTASNLGAGVYQVTVTDAGNCQAVGQITVTEPSAVTASIVTSSNVVCRGGATGTATALGQGGVGSYSYAWSNGQSTQTIANLVAGSYQVTVGDANGCTQTTSVVITQPASGIDANAVVSSNYNGQQISCFGAADGEATVNVVNGTIPYSFLWSNGQTGATATGLGAGTVCVTVTDANGCTDASCVSLTAPSQVTAVVTNNTSVDCRGNATGSLTVAGQGGVGAYTYLWDANALGQTTATASNLVAGFYCATVTDINGCSNVICATVAEPLVALSANASVTSNYNGRQVSCAGSTDGSLSATGNGGTGPYSYLWSAGNQTTAAIAGVGAGNYQVTVTDARGCQAVASVTVSEPVAVTATTVVNNNVSCLGLADGSVTASGSGGTAPYSYAWNTSATVPTLVNLAANSYTVTVTDANGCSSTSTVVITQPATGVQATANVVSNYNGAQVSCINAADGEALVQAVGGQVALDYSYQWDGFAANQTTALATGLQAGINYQVTVSDDNGCFAVATVSLSSPSAVTATATSIDPVACVGSATGTASANGAGGTGAYGYLWSVNGQTTQNATGLPAGIHTVTVSDANGCESTAFVTITQPNNSLVVTTSVTSSYGAGSQITCAGATDGSVSVIATGGQAPYSYQWSANAGNATSVAVNNLGAGTYTVTVTDAVGCEVVSNISLVAPSPLQASIVGQLDVSCRNESTGVVTVAATVGTGTPGYTYTINAPIPSNNGTFSGLAAGAYTVTVTDLNFCSTTVPVLITQPATILQVAASVSSSYNGRAVSCNGASDGEATVVATQGTQPYTYQWNAAANGQTTAIATGLSAGSYSVVVTDANGCLATASVTLTEPSAVTATLQSTTNVICATNTNGTARVTAAGGTPGYSYAIPGQTNANGQFNGLAAGNYVVTVTDANGCSTTVPFVIISPNALTIASINVTSNYNGQQISCNGACNAAATVVAAGGTGTYNFVWSNGQTTFTATNLCVGATVTVTDQAGCTVSAAVTLTQPSVLTASVLNQVNIGCNGASTGSVQVDAQGGTPNYSYNIGNGPQANGLFGNLAAGNYVVTVTDLNNCETTVSVSISQGSAVNATVAVTSNFNGQQVSCANSADATATVTASGGAAPYTFVWSDGQTGATATNLGVGVYTVTITDANNCDLVRSVTVTVPNALNLSVVAQTNILCAGTATGSFRVQAVGGVAPYIYSIDNGNSFTNTVEYTNLPASTYCVIVRDANGCTDTVCTTVTEPAQLQGLVSNQVDVSCNGIADGTATVTGVGGVAPYLYDFNFNNVFLSSNTFNNLNAGNYVVRVRDANGCTFNVPVVISQPTPVVLNLVQATAPNCAGACNGVIEVAASGGTSPYEYSIDGQNFSATAVFNNLCGGTYTLSVRDAQGCVRTRTVTLNQPNVLTATATVTSNYNGRQVSCFGAADGTASVVAAGGTVPYTYAWSMGANTPSVTGLAANINYTVTITDANGCNTVASVSLTQPSELSASVLAQTNVSCGGGNNGAVTVAATQGTGTGPYTYNIGTGATAQSTFTGLTAGSYIITVTDANACEITLPVVITEPVAVQITALAVTSNFNGAQVSCAGASNATAAVTATGGTGLLSYLWSNGQTTASATGLAAGVHTVRVQDANGCSVSGTITVTQPSAVTATAVANNAGCFGGNQGEITVTAGGGTAPYSYALNGATPQFNNVFTGLSAGTYSIVISDANGCATTRVVTISQSASLNAVAAITSNYNGQQLTCATSSDATATVAASGGTAPYTYLWSNGQNTANATGLAAGLVSVTVTDAAGCDVVATATVTAPSVINLAVSQVVNANCASAPSGSFRVNATGGAGNYTYNIGTSTNGTGLFTALVANTYTVTVTDANGCSATTTATISEPSAIQINLTASNVSCFGLQDGQVTTNVQGGTPFSNGGYLYAWNTGATTRNIGNLGFGTYSVTVTDAAGCTVSQAGVVTEPQQILFNVTDITHVGCNGAGTGSITLTAAGGTGSFEFSNDGGQTFQAGTSPFVFSNLNGGTYALVVRDANNRSCELVRTVEVLESGAIEASATTNNVACANDTNGSATVNATGGSGSYTYLWSDGQTTQTATNLAANLQDGVFVTAPYSVTVTDINGCTVVVDNIGVASPEAMSIEATNLQNVSCFAGTDGAAYVTITGGVPSYSINWSNGATTDTIRNVEAFNYVVVVTDANGCTDTATVAISEPTFPLIAALSGDTTSCFGSIDGVIRIDSIIGGTPINGNEYEFSFSENGPYGSAAILSQGLPAGQYTVYVRDANACVTAVNDLFIRQPADITVQAYNNATIRLGETVELYATTTGANFDSSRVTWSYVDATGNLVEVCNGGNCLGSFTPSVDILFENRVFIVDLGNGCGDTSSVFIQVDRQQTLFVPNAFTPNGDGQNDVFMPYASTDVRIVKRFLIFDRWGELVHEASEFVPGDFNAAWDGSFKGKNMNQAVFIYFVEAELINGERVIRKGDVTLMR